MQEGTGKVGRKEEVAGLVGREGVAECCTAVGESFGFTFQH